MGLVKKERNVYTLPPKGKMAVPCQIYLKEELLPYLEEEAIGQLSAAAALPGVFKYVLGMPDIHTGYGLPIGGVLAVTYPDGVVSAGAVGMDINCGVRLLTTNLSRQDLGSRELQKLLAAIEELVPTGIGTKSKYKLDRQLKKIVEEGVPYLVKLGLADAHDLERIEEGGCLPGGDLAACSKEARARMDQLSTLGGGNHFIEISMVDRIFDKETASFFNLAPEQIVIMIHSGSRGFGHQICQDYSREMAQQASRHGITLPNRGLACAPIQSELGKRYLAAMACAVNFAFANRQLIQADVIRAIAKVLGKETVQIKLLYDVAHNIAKRESHFGRELLLHRKGATRALPPGHKNNPRHFMATGHPVLLPGSMGTHSYIATGLERAQETFCSVNHGAGRVLSRAAARKSITGTDFEEQMADIHYNVSNYKRIVDEAPQAYKDIHLVVDTLAEIGIINLVANVRPMAVIKGEG
ncbi:MAG: RtcB family protein [Firmicutes bacterium]|nr:RtcB family protein [Bacillota bacterium]